MSRHATMLVAAILVGALSIVGSAALPTRGSVEAGSELNDLATLHVDAPLSAATQVVAARDASADASTGVRSVAHGANTTAGGTSPRAILDLHVTRPGRLVDGLVASIDGFPADAVLESESQLTCTGGRLRIVVAAPARLAAVTLLDPQGGTTAEAPLDVHMRPGTHETREIELGPWRRLALTVRAEQGSLTGAASIRVRDAAVDAAGSRRVVRDWPADDEGRAILESLGQVLHCEAAQQGSVARLALVWDQTATSQQIVAASLSLARAVPWNPRVLDEAGNPVADATVCLEPAWDPVASGVLDASLRAERPQATVARTANDGRIAAELAMDLPYRCRVRHKDHAEHVAMVVSSALPAEIHLSPGLVLRAQVVDSQSTPLADVVVQPLDARLATVHTDSDGRFAYRGVPSEPGLLVRLCKQGFVTREVWLLGSPDGSRETRVRLVAGLRFSGHVLDGEGRDVAGAELRLTREADASVHGPALVAMATSGSDGRFEADDLAPGDYRLEVVYPDDGRWRYVGEVTAGWAEYIVCIDPTAEALLAGSVRDADAGHILRDFKITVLRDEGGMQIGPTFRIHDELGRFALPGLTPGSVEVRVAVPGRDEVVARVTLRGGENRVEMLVPGLR